MPVGTDWTLFFKFHKTTVVLPVDPTDNFTEIKARLFVALDSTPNLHDINGVPLPHSMDEIQLAIPKEAGNLHSGWKSIEIDDDDEDKPGKGKTGLKNCPKGVGLREGGVLAFRFGDAVEEDDWPVKIPSFDDLDREQRANGDIPGLSEAMAKTTESR